MSYTMYAEPRSREGELGPGGLEPEDQLEEEFFGRLTDLVRRGLGSPTVRRIRRTAKRVGDVIRIVGLLTKPLPEPVLPPPEPPAIVQERKKKGEQRPPEEAELGWASTARDSSTRETLELMEHLAHEATHATSEAEASALLAALVPITARVVPAAAPVIHRFAPDLIRGIGQASALLRRDPATRPFVRMFPAMLLRTAATVSERLADGRPVMSTDVMRALGAHAARTIGDPRVSTHAWWRSKPLDHAWHRRVYAPSKR